MALKNAFSSQPVIRPAELSTEHRVNSKNYLTIGLITGAMLTLGAAMLAMANTEQLPDPLEAGWEGESVCEVMHEDDALRVLKCTFPPGVGHERHYHDRHFGYVLVGGRMQITDAEGTRVVDIPDDSTWDSDGVEWHEVVNVGETTSQYLIVEPKE